MDFTELKISGIPNIYPTTFYDYINFSNRLKELPEFHLKSFITEDLYTDTIDSSISEQKMLQQAFFKKYEIECYINEKINIDKIKLAKTVTVYTSAEFFNCRILNIAYNKLSDTDFYKVVITMYRMKLDNESVINYYSYPEISIYDYHTLQFSSDKNIDDEIDFEDDETFDIYTVFNPKFDRTNYKEKKDDVDGIEILSKTTDFETVTIKFFLTETEFLKLKKYGKRCFYYSSLNTPAGCKLTLSDGTTTYTSQQNVDITVKKTDFYMNYYEVDVTLFVDIIRHYHF